MIDKNVEKFQILCLTGGGFRGLYTASVLAHIENYTGRKIHESFDLICGTSIGGIIATGLAFGCPAKDIHDCLALNGEKIFTKKYKGLFKAPYKSEGLKDAINSLLTCSQTLVQI